MISAWNPARLAEARKEAGLSQEALADRMTEILQREAQPVRTRNVVRWERPRGVAGAHAPHADFLAAIAQATGKPLDFFLAEGPGEPKPFPAEAA